MAEFSNKREAMVFLQIKSRGILDERILNAFLEIPRENFVRKEDQRYAYYDGALEIGYGQTISQPYVVALMTKLLEPKKDDIVLEIGTGSGYQSAILSKLVDSVTSYEIIPELCKFASQNLMSNKIENIKIICEDAAEIKDKNLYDKIIITAATSLIPIAWIDVLKNNGLIVVPENVNGYQILNKYEKRENILVLIEKSIPVKFVPLKGKYEN